MASKSKPFGDTGITSTMIAERPSKGVSRKQKKPSNPLVNEENILSVLRSEPQLETLMYFRRSAVFAVVDAFDRGVTRDFFASILSNCVNLNEVARRLELTAHIFSDFDKGVLTREKLGQLIVALTENFEKYRVAIAEEARVLAEMPQADEVIH